MCVTDLPKLFCREKKLLIEPEQVSSTELKPIDTFWTILSHHRIIWHNKIHNNHNRRNILPPCYEMLRVQGMLLLAFQVLFQA